MNLVEQAVFTSAETSRTAGYQLVAKSCGILEEDERALSTWGPSHGALLKSEQLQSSVNFHALPCGNFCVSQTTASGNEYSGRGTRIYTQCLVVSPEVLKHFANNALAVVRAATGSGLLRQYEKVPANLEPVSLIGRAPVVDSSVLTRARREFGPGPIAHLVQTALQCTSMAIAGTAVGDLAVGVLLNFLPPQLRSEFSFSTGLRTSARRPFRVVVIGDDAEERRRARQDNTIMTVDLAGKKTANFLPTDDWARAVYRIVETGRTSVLSRWFDDLSDDVSIDRLNATGLELLEELGAESVSPSGLRSPMETTSDSRRDTSLPENVPSEGSGEIAHSSSSRASRQLAHAAHSQFSGTSSATERVAGPSAALGADHPEVLARLEMLDDLVFDAIKGDSGSLEQLRTAWPRLKEELGAELLGQSREQYLRYALQVWEKCVEASGVRPTTKAVNALDVLCLLFDEV